MNEKIIDNFVWGFDNSKYKSKYWEDPFNTIIKVMEKKFGIIPKDVQIELFDPFLEWFVGEGKDMSGGLKKFLMGWY